MQHSLYILFLLFVPSLVFAQPQYYEWAFDCEYENCYDFYEERAIVTRGKLKGFIDNHGAEVIKPKYHIIDAYSQELASAGYINFKKMFSRSGFINREGTMVVDTRFEITSPFQEGLACVKRKGKWGFVNLNGDYIIKSQYQEAQNFSGGLAAVKTGGKWGFIDPTGVMIVKPKFELTLPFRNGRAPVRYKGRWGYIDKLGEFVIQPRFTYAGQFKEGLARVKVKNQWGFINESGSFEITADFDYLHDFYQGLARAKRDGKWGYIQNFGEHAFVDRYEDAGDFKAGLARVKKEGKWGYINLSGQLVIPHIFTTAHDFREGLARVNEGGKKRGYIRYVEPKEKDMAADTPLAKARQMTKREIKIGQTIQVKSKNLEVFIYDHKKLDGDIVSINFEGRWILKDYELQAKKYALRLDLEGEEPYLLLYANNLGKEPPNTVALTISDGLSQQEVILNSDLKSCDIIYFKVVE